MLKDHAHKGTGLRGIEVADTSISAINGEEGTLQYRGFNIEDLAKNSSFEEVTYLLLYGELPTPKQFEEFKSILFHERNLPLEVLHVLQDTPKQAPPMSVLQSVISLLASFDLEISEGSKEVTQRRSVRIVAKIPTIIAAWEKIRNGKDPIKPSAAMGHAENFLYMLKGKAVNKEIIRCFDVALILHAEHSFNASTFTSRVISSTGADIYAAISGAVGSLSGKLHGGANSRVMQNLYNIGSPDKVEEWILEQFDKKNRIMGMGHAVYRTMDPRARILQKMAEGMINLPEADPKWLEMTKMIANIAQAEFRKRKNRDIYPNVDLFSSSVYTTMGIPMDLFTPLFAMSRVSGWSAHAIEEQFPETPEIKPVLYRPSADYTGNYCGPTGCVYVPVDKR